MVNGLGDFLRRDVLHLVELTLVTIEFFIKKLLQLTGHKTGKVHLTFILAHGLLRNPLRIAGRLQIDALITNQLVLLFVICDDDIIMKLTHLLHGAIPPIPLRIHAHTAVVARLNINFLFFHLNETQEFI